MDLHTEVQHVNFGVLNFLEFDGQNDKWIDTNGSSRRIGSSEIIFDDFRIEIMENLSLSENKRFLSRNDGYTVTHTGLIKHYDGSTYSIADAQDVLRTLRAFLSFARGAACGLTLVKVTMPNSSYAIVEWGATHTEPWMCGCETWLPVRNGGDILSQLFPEFSGLCRDPDWKDAIFTVIDWYVNGNVSPFHIGITVAQAALETLSHKVLQCKMKERPMHEKIRQALKSFKISQDIP